MGGGSEKILRRRVKPTHANRQLADSSTTNSALVNRLSEGLAMRNENPPKWLRMN
jgi:hypothetical protein